MTEPGSTQQPGNHALAVRKREPSTNSALVRADTSAEVIDLMDASTVEGTGPKISSERARKLVHKPNKSQKGFKLSVTDTSGNTQELLIFVKRNEKDTYNKKGADPEQADDYPTCFVTFDGE